MPSKKKEKTEKPVAEVKNEAKKPEVKENVSPVQIKTSAGNTLDRVKVFPIGSTVMVQAEYGKLHPEEKKSADQRKDMKRLLSRPLSPAQSLKYQELAKTDQNAAREYAAREVYPMHIDEAKFDNREAEINGRPVNYINFEKQTVETLALSEILAGKLKIEGITPDDVRSGKVKAKDLADKGLKAEDLSEDVRKYIGKTQVAFGMKGDPKSRFMGLLTNDEKLSLDNRVEAKWTKVKEKGADGKMVEKNKAVVVGGPMSKADIAAAVEKRVLARQQAHNERLASAQKFVDYVKANPDRAKVPEGIQLTGLRFVNTSDPAKKILKGSANGIDVSALLTKNETTAMLNKMLPMEEIAMANKGFGNKVRAIATGNQLVASEEAAVAAIVARASDKNAKAFTPEQYKLLNEFVSAEDNAADRKVMFDDLMSKASEKLEGINPKWIEDVRHELDDLAEGAEREQGRQQSMGR